MHVCLARNTHGTAARFLTCHALTIKKKTGREGNQAMSMTMATPVNLSMLLLDINQS